LTIEEIEMTRKVQRKTSKTSKAEADDAAKREVNRTGALGQGSAVRRRSRELAASHPTRKEDREAPPSTDPARPRQGSKLGIVLELLEGPEGVTLARLVAVTGWLPHTTRAALTGLRKRGYAVTSEKAKAEGARGSLYRIRSTRAA
jgi:hypothetical protein